MTDLEHKRALKAAFKAKEQESLLRSMQLSVLELRALLNHLDTVLASGCDHTLNETLIFLTAQKLEPSLVIPWLQEHGGYCDCEVLANVESDYESILRL